MDGKSGGADSHHGLWRRVWWWLRGIYWSRALLPAPRAQVIPNIDGGEHNLLHKNQLRNDLRIEFDLWAFSEPTPSGPDMLELFLDDRVAPVATRTWDAPIQADQLFIMLDKAYLTSEGPHQLYYRVTLGISGTQSDSDVFGFHVDATRADLNDDDERLIFPPDASTEITARYLELHDDQVVAVVPDYYSVRVGDRVTPYWEQAPVGSLALPEKTLGLEDLGKPIALVFTGTQIRRLGDGLRYVTYRVTDRAGNESNLSAPVVLNVNAAPLPRYWPAPQVKDSFGTVVPAVLNPLNATNGVTVWVPANAVFHPEEVASIFWGAPGSPGAAQTTAFISGAGPWRGFITKEQVAAHIGRSLIITYGLLDNNDLPVSNPLRLMVASIGHEHLPQVQSTAAINNNGRISLATLTDTGDTIRLPPWPLIATTQTIKLWVVGSGQDGLTSECHLLNAAPVTPTYVSSGVVVTLGKDWLASLRINSVLVIYVTVSFNGSEDWVTFPSSGNIVVVP